MISRKRRFAYLSLPAFVVLLVSVGVSFALGGAIAGAIAGFVFGGAFLINCLLLFVLVLASRIGSPGYLVLIGAGVYLVSLLAIAALWSFSGQSQIM
jgi:hypothetical protein